MAHTGLDVNAFVVTAADLGGQTMALVPLADNEPTMELWPRVGRDVLGMSKDATYHAANAGEIPVIRIGRRFRVPTASLRVMLGMDA